MIRAAPRTSPAPEDHLRRFRATRDPAALGALFDATAPVLLRVALSIAPDAASAENALQETFLAVLEAPESWDETRAVMPWLLGILHRQVGKVRRDNARAPDPLRLPPPLRDDDPAAAAMSREEMDRVRAAIDELPEPYRAVAVLRWRHGLDPADIADVRSEPPGTTRSLLSRALVKLRERLGGAAFALLGAPPGRGLAGVRRALMQKASAATATSGAAAAVGGALVMKKLVAACVLLVALGGGTWWTVNRVADARRAPPARATETPPDVASKHRRGSDAAPASIPTGDIAPVNLDQCDRDLDLFGRVVDEDGKPVAGATVETMSHPWRGIDMRSTSRWNEEEAGPAARTAADGTFAIRLERGAKFDLRVAAATFGTIVRADCQAGERVEIVLRHGATLDVTTVDEAGAPVAGVRVKLRHNARRFGPVDQTCEGVTDGAGHVAVPGLLPGPVGADYLHPVLGAPKWRQLVLPATGTLAIRVTMLAGVTIRGRVTDADTGAPIAGALVDSFNFDRPVTTGADGAYALRGWTYGAMTYFLLEVKADGYCSVYRDVPDTWTVDVALTRGDRVTGRLVREDGSPVGGARVGVDGTVNERGITGSATRPSDADAMRTAADGRFDLGNLSRDIPHTLISAAPGLARTVLTFERHFWTGSAIDLGDVVMHAPHSIEGVAVDLDGRPIADATVSLLAADFGRDPSGWTLHAASRRSDDLGRFRFPDLVPGDYTATVSAPGVPRGPSVSLDVPDDGDLLGVRLTLGGSKTMSVLVVDDLDVPQADASVAIDVNADSKQDGLLSAATGADGRARFRGLGAVPATTYVWVDRSDGTSVGRFGPFPIGGDEVRIVARRQVEVRGTVRGEDGKPLASSIEATLHRDGTKAGGGSSDDTGAFTARVPLGETVDLWARGWVQVPYAEGGGWHFTGFEGRLNGVAAPADGVTITLRAVATTYDRALTVVVLDSSGAPVPGVELGVYEPPKSWKLTTDRDGRVRFARLPSHLVCVNFAERSTADPPRPRDIPPLRVNAMPQGQEIVAKWRAGAAIRGRVVDGAGRGVAEAHVQVTTPDAAYIETTSDADGRFVTYGLPDSPNRLDAAALVDGAVLRGTADRIVPSDADVVLTVAPSAK